MPLQAESLGRPHGHTIAEPGSTTGTTVRPWPTSCPLFWGLLFSVRLGFTAMLFIVMGFAWYGKIVGLIFTFTGSCGGKVVV